MAKAEKAEKKPMTKSQIIAELAEKTSLQKKDIAAVMDQLTEMIRKNISAKGTGVFTFPGLVKIERKRKEKVPAKKGVLNRFTGELYDRPAKPAHNVVKVRALKALKDMV